MTRLERKALVRAVGSRYGELVLELTAVGVSVRHAGARKRMGPVSWDAIYSLAAKAEAAAELAERRARRAAYAGRRAK